MNKQILHPLPQITIKDFSGLEIDLSIFSLENPGEQYLEMMTTPHRAGFFQIILFNEGNGTIKLDSQNYRLKPHTLFAVSSGQVSILNLEENAKGYAVLFTPGYIYKYPEDLQWINELTLFDPLADTGLLELSDFEFFELQNLIKKIDHELKTGERFAKEEILFNSLKTLIILAERAKRKNILDYRKECADAAYISAFRKKLEEDYYQSRMVKYYADNLNITAKKLNQVICGYYGKPVKQLIEERVLLEIKRLLIHSDKTIKEIGNSLGFKDPTNFNKYVRKYMNTTPADYRSLYR